LSVQLRSGCLAVRLIVILSLPARVILGLPTRVILSLPTRVILSLSKDDGFAEPAPFDRLRVLGGSVGLRVLGGSVDWK